MVEVPASSANRIFGLLEIPEYVKLRPQTGDCLKINFDPSKNLETESWSTVVVELLPFASLGKISILLIRPFDLETQTHSDLVLNVIPSRGLGHTAPGASGATTSNDGRRKYQVFREAAQITDPRTSTHRSGSWQELWLIPNEVGVITGPPGKGKTNWIVQNVLLFIYSNIQARSETKGQVLVTSPNNSPADEVAQRPHEAAVQNNMGKDAIIIRVHSIDTEQDHIFHNADYEYNSYVSPIDEERLLAELTEITDAPALYKLNQDTTKRPHGVSDNHS
ncbi:hypothetical protein MMC18_003205 [Xylographa bjoerkii]|nr:hypothetical protein [Xylographa bjoerkii]